MPALNGHSPSELLLGGIKPLTRMDEENDQLVEQGVAAGRLRQFYPYSYALVDECLSDYCWYCLNEARETAKAQGLPERDDQGRKRKLLRCGGCQQAWFCNAACQKQSICSGWHDHAFECAAIKKTNLMPGTHVRLLARTCNRYKMIVRGKDKKYADFYLNRTHKRELMDLMDHMGDFENNPPALHMFEAMYNELLQWNMGEQVLDKKTTFMIHCRIRINSISISNHNYSRDIAKGLYPDLANYDHSCRPNASYACRQTFVMNLRTMNPYTNIDDLSQTFISYIELLSTKQTRQEQLRDNWYFTCRCDRCLDNDEHLLTAIRCPNCHAALPIDDPRTKKVVGGGGAMICGKCQYISGPDVVAQGRQAHDELRTLIDNRQLATYDQVMQLIHDYQSYLPPVNIQICRLCQAAIRMSLSSHVEQRLKLYELSMDCMRLCYAFNWPLAYHMASTGVCAVKLDQYKAARKYLIEAVQLLEQTVGVQHEMSITARQHLETVEKKLTEINNKRIEQQQQQQQQQQQPQIEA